MHFSPTIFHSLSVSSSTGFKDRTISEVNGQNFHLQEIFFHKKIRKIGLIE